MYLSGHPMAKYKTLACRLKCAEISSVIREEDVLYKDNERVKVLGLISSIKKKITKSDTTMAFVTLEDTTGGVEVIVFPKTLAENPSLLLEGNIEDPFDFME